MRRIIGGLLLSVMPSMTVATSAVSAHTSGDVWTSGGGSTWNVKPTAGTGLSRAWARCVSSGTIITGPWKTLFNTSLANCGPQGFTNKGFDTTN